MTASLDRSGRDGFRLQIGTFLFDGVDQIDVTGPFEVLARLPNSTHRFYAVEDRPIRDAMGMRLLPDATLPDAPQLDVLHVPGGPGNDPLMDDETVLNWLRSQANGASAVFSVCTGALLLGAAGLILGKRATTHWTTHHLLHWFGAAAVKERVVRDGTYLFTAGVTAGIDGALQLAADLRGRAVAEQIQLEMEYAPKPPFNSGTPETASAEVLADANQSNEAMATRRAATAERIGARLKFNSAKAI